MSIAKNLQEFPVEYSLHLIYVTSRQVLGGIVIQLSNGHKLEYVVASGALGFDGQGWPWEKPLVWTGFIKPELFTVFTKSLSRHKRRGNLRWWNPRNSVRLIPGGAVNRIELTNPGIEWWCKKIAPTIQFDKFPIGVSIVGNQEELVEMAKMLNRFPLKAIEINVSCPNEEYKSQSTEYIIRCARTAVRAVTRHPIILKLACEQDVIGIAQGVEGYVDAISLNSVKWDTAFKYIKSPLGGGGVSGRPAQECNWAAVERLAFHDLVPVIAPSIMEMEDMAKVRRLGAKAISFGAIHLRTPWRPTKFVEWELENGQLV